jgi:prepilin-type N-terminal cleavage/methylation domain-containing protein
MSFNNIKTKMRSERGFTIVELLIVIVVIGILAAITIVAYNGVTARANTTAAKLAANSVLKKAEAYNAELTGYPVTWGALTTATSDKSYNLVGVTFSTTAAGAFTAKPSSPSTLNFYTCAGNLGTQVGYWDYQNNVVATLTTGACTSPAFQGS